MFTFHFEKLEVWQKAIDFAEFVYSVTGGFPEHERFGLTNQMRRAAVSISSNIAEGSSRRTGTDFARFIDIATGSVYEVVSQSAIGRRRGYLSVKDYERTVKASSEVTRMLRALRKAVLQDKS